jgi:hypothetical protein
MPASRSVVSVLLRELGDVSLHPQGRPAGGRLRLPSSAARTKTARCTWRRHPRRPGILGRRGGAGRLVTVVTSQL